MRDVQADEPRYYPLDHQCTVQALTDSTGAVTDRFASDAWGMQVKRTGTSINRQWYIGNLGYIRQVDQALDYVRARYQSPQRARWMSRDPVRRLKGAVYIYAGARTTVYVDPSGLQPAGGLEAQLAFPFATGCDSADLIINWKVPPQSTGWIVQHLRVLTDVRDCKDPNKSIQVWPPPAEYWEAWEVVSGQVRDVPKVVDILGDLFVTMVRNQDIDYFHFDGPRETWGSVAFVGRAKFIPTQSLLTIPPWRVPGNVHAANLTSIDAPGPPPISDNDTIAHYMVVWWNCCCGKSEHTGFSIPGGTEK